MLSLLFGFLIITDPVDLHAGSVRDMFGLRFLVKTTTGRDLHLWISGVIDNAFDIIVGSF